MDPIVIIFAFVLAASATICCSQVARSSRKKRREAEAEVDAAELRREAENTELVIARLDALQRETGFNVSAAKHEAQQVLGELRRPPSRCEPQL